MPKKPPKIPKDKIQQQAQKHEKLSPIEAKVLSLATTFDGGSSDNDNPYVALKYFRQTFECFSAWEKDELKAFSSFLGSVQGRTWRQVLETSGKGENKTGLAYTPYEINTTKNGAESHLKEVRKLISEDIGFFELRVDQKMRVHGFRAKAAFFLVLLDREHRVFPS